MLGLGESFQYKDFTTGEWSHIWVAVTTPSGSNGDALAFSITTKRAWTKDISCIIRPGDHPALTAESVINYGEVERPKVLPFATMSAGPAITVFPAVTAAVLQRILDGAKVSDFLEPKFLRML